MPALTEFDVNLTIGSSIGFRQVGGGASNGAIIGPYPIVQTLRDLEGNTYPFIEANSAILDIDPLDTFYIYPGGTSAVQNVVIHNRGNLALVINSASDISFTSESVTPNLSATFPISIAPLSSSTVALSYSSNDIGEYVNYFIINSNHYSRKYKVITRQTVSNDSRFTATPTVFSVSTTEIGKSETETIHLIPITNGIEILDFALPFTTSISGSDGWSVSTGSDAINTIYLTWDPNQVNNINGTYNSVLTITAETAAPVLIYNTAVVNIDYTKYKNIATWISPAAYNNSIIGISLDYINSVKTITIGVGAGGDGTPVYADGGNEFVSLRNIAFDAGPLKTPYPYWAIGYRIPLESVGTYLSGQLDINGLPLYEKKVTEGLNYSDYFGYEQSPGYRSMFIVDHDSVGNITVEINNLRELSGDPAFDATLENLTRAFHYYSDVDNTIRYYQLGAPVQDGTVGYLFRGFTTSYSTATSAWSWSTEVSLVNLPT